MWTTMQASSMLLRTSVFRFWNKSTMKVSLLFAVSLISFTLCNEPQRDNQPTEIGARKEDRNGKGNRNLWKRETSLEICDEAKDVSVRSAYISDYFIQLFIETSNGSRGWTSQKAIKWPRETYPSYIARFSLPDQLGNFEKMDELPLSQEFKNDSKFKRISASFLHFSDSPKEKGYLVIGLNAYEFETESDVLPFYQPTGNVKAITDFFKEVDKLLKPEDKLEEVVSVAIIKWVQKDKIKDHAIYKIILKTLTKKLVKAYFKITSKGEIMGLNSEPFVPSAVVMEDEDEFDLLEESALYNVRESKKLSMGYQFTKEFAFPIYYEYNPETNAYKEYPMRMKQGFNTKLEKLGDKVPDLNRYIVPTKTWLGCPETTFCLGRSFDAVFFADNQYYVILDKIVYTLALLTDRPDVTVPSKPLFSTAYFDYVDAAFTLEAMVFFIADERVYYKTAIGDQKSKFVMIKDMFPGIDANGFFTVSAVIVLDKAKDVSEDKLPVSKLQSSRQRKYDIRHERAAQMTEVDIPKKMVYVYFSKEDGRNVYQYEIESKEPPKFKLLSKKSYNEVNAALPYPVSLVFTVEDKVVTMVHHFMIEQSSATYFTQTEKASKFTLVSKYFGCNSENVENKLTKDFLQKYVAFAGPKPGVNILAFPADAYEKIESTTDVEKHGSPNVNNDEDKNEVKVTGSSAQISTASFISQAVVIIVLSQTYFN